MESERSITNTNLGRDPVEDIDCARALWRVTNSTPDMNASSIKTGVARARLRRERGRRMIRISKGGTYQAQRWAHHTSLVAMAVPNCRDLNAMAATSPSDGGCSVIRRPGQVDFRLSEK